MTTADRLQNLLQQIAAYEKKYSRPSGSVQLLAVSKQQAVHQIQEAFTAGQNAFGENYLQEALPKIDTLSHLPIEWHYIGHIQANKTRKIAEHFAFVHSVDSLKIAERLNDQRPDHLPPLNICLEINLGSELTKAGIRKEDALDLANACLKLERLRLRGLMAIPPQGSLPARQYFQQLRELFISLNQAGQSLDTLSMGMSEDFEAAIAEGSTMVRIGRAIFGERHPAA